MHMVRSGDRDRVDIISESFEHLTIILKYGCIRLPLLNLINPSEINVAKGDVYRTTVIGHYCGI